MEILFWMTVAVGVAWTLVFVLNLKEWRATPRILPRPGGAVEGLPKVSVIIPARNEEANIAECLQSLMRQDHVDLELIVVDDCSDDQTVSIVEKLMAVEPRIRLVRCQAPPTTWTGKCHACWQGVQQGRPSGEWLLFVDADTRHHPQSVSSALHDALQQQVDLLSLVPHLEGRTFWEKLVQPSVAALIALFNKPSRVNDPTNPHVFANGQYMLIRTQAYDQIGGHRSVAGKVLEDVELAQRVVSNGFRLRLAIATGLFSTRMYKNLGDLVRGWMKNLYLILHSKMTHVIVAAFSSFFLSLWPAMAGVIAAVLLISGWQGGPQWWLWCMVGIYALVLVFQTTLRGLNRWYPGYTILAPLANTMVLIILARSAWRHRRGKGVSWKGRDIHNQTKDSSCQ